MRGAGVAPERRLSGSFNVRSGPVLHRRAGMSLNALSPARSKPLSRVGPRSVRTNDAGDTAIPSVVRCASAGRPGRARPGGARDWR
ncbi:MAG: toxin-antitoxin system HicB family antitoxin [Geminicoccaceae bacterium]